MAYSDRYDAAFGIYVQRYVRKVHTNIRATVVGVNYAGPSVDVQPMAYTEFPNGVIDRYPVIFDVPLHLPAGNGGKARLTMPIKPGDIVGLSFSERNEGNNSDVNTHELFPGWAVTEIFAEKNAKPIDPDNVVLENDQSSLTLKPNGDIGMANPKVKFQAQADGNVQFSNGAGTFEMAPSGEITANGAKISPDGKVTTAGGVDLDDFYKEYKDHVHGGVERGNAKSSGPE